jgi:hypothetical protein
MQNSQKAQLDQAELPGMLATLCFYDNWLGPCHPQTLHLMVQVAGAYCQAGIPDPARALLERAVRDIGRHLGPNHDLRFTAMAALRDLLTAQGDYEEAVAVQNDLAAHEKRASLLQ